METELMHNKPTKRILKLLTLFVTNQFFENPDIERDSPKVFHYYKEIIRFWNKINFIVKKTQRSLKFNESSEDIKIPEFLYSTYRVICENAANQDLINELDLIKETEIRNFSTFFNKLRTFSWKKALDGKSQLEELSIIEAIPSFFIRHLSAVMPIDFIGENLQYMNDFIKKQTFTVHVGGVIEKTLNLCFINQLQKDINKREPIFRKDADINNLFHVSTKNRKDFVTSELYQSGDMMVVDKGSAAVIDVLNPKPDEFICDICAAPGIKTYMTTQKSNDKSRVLAGDFHEGRTRTMKVLLNRLKVKNVNIINADGIEFPVRDGIQFEKILLDAPCTGSGTFLANPELKWRQNEKFLHQNITLQEKLLKRALELLKPNGILVYSTCSLYPEEGEHQILKVMDRLIPMELPTWFSNSYEINDSTIPGTGRLFPSTHQTQGFFVGKFKKKE